MSFSRSRRWRGRRRSAPRSLWRKVVDYALAFLILALLGLLALRLDRTTERSLTGSAIVHDGDTLTVAGERLRLKGIDAPEFDQTCRAGGAAYPCGRRAREALRQRIGNRVIACSGWSRDKYRRFLATCAAGGVDLNGALVEDGWALAYGGYEAEERAARAGKKGLWAGEFDRPSQWRAREGAVAEDPHDFLRDIINFVRELFRFS